MPAKKKDYWGRIVTIPPENRRLRVSNFALGDLIKYGGQKGVVVGNGCSCIHILTDKEKIKQWKDEGQPYYHAKDGIHLAYLLPYPFICTLPELVKLIR